MFSFIISIFHIIDYFILNLLGYKYLICHVMQELHKKRLQITEKPKYKRKPKGTCLSCISSCLAVLVFYSPSPIRGSNSLGNTGRSIKVTSDYKFTDKDACADSSPGDVHHMSSVTGIQGVCLFILNVGHYFLTYFICQTNVFSPLISVQFREKSRICKYNLWIFRTSAWTKWQIFRHVM